MKHQVPLFVSAAVAAVADASMPSIASVPGAASYVVPTAFPTTVYSSYYGKAPSSYGTTYPFTNVANQSSRARLRSPNRPSLTRSSISLSH